MSIDLNIHEIILQLLKTDKDSDFGKLLPIDKVLPGYFYILEEDKKYKFHFNPHKDYENPKTVDINVEDNDERVEKLEALNSDIRDYNKWVDVKNTENKSEPYQRLEVFEVWKFLVVNTKNTLLKRDTEDRLRSINCKELFLLRMKLPEKEFVNLFNKTLFDYIRGKVQKSKEFDTWDENNIWYQPNKEFDHWFDLNDIEDKEIDPLNQPDNGQDYYPKQGYTKSKLAYIKLYHLTKKHMEKHPTTSEGKPATVRQSVKFIYNNNRDIFPIWSEESLNKLYYTGEDLSINN